MSTTKTFKVNQNISRQLKCRAVGYYDYTNIVTPTKENSDINVEMQKYDGLKYTWNSNGGGIPIIDFSGTVLPWKYGMNSYLETTRYCLSSKSDTPNNIAIYQPIYRYIENIGGVTDNDGVVSDFSTSKYLKFKENFNPNYTWCFIIKFNFNTIDNSAKVLLGYNSSGLLKLAIYERKIEFGVSTSASDWSIGQVAGTQVLQANKDYWVKAEFTGSAYNVYISENGSDYNLEGTINSSEAFTMPDELLIGNGGWQFDEVFTGSIDLNETSIKGYFLVDGQYVEQTRKMFDGTYVIKRYNNYTVNGTPTINDGIASGFSSSNYLSLKEPFKPLDKPWEINLKITTPSSFGLQRMIGSVGDYYRTIGGEVSANNTLGFGITSNGYSWDIGWLSSSTVLEPNVPYWIRLSFTGSEYKFELSSNGIDYHLENSITSSTPVYQNDDSIINLGYHGTDSYTYFRGSIDLNECYIKSNGKTIRLYGTVTEELYGIRDGVSQTSQIAYCYVNRDKTLVLRKTKTENLDTTDWYLGEVYLKLGLPNPDLDV